MTQDIKVKISNLTKIFGPKAESVLKHVDNGMGKDDLLEMWRGAHLPFN